MATRQSIIPAAHLRDAGRPSKRTILWVVWGTALVIGLSPLSYGSAEPLLRLTDAAFTDGVVNRQPRNRLTSFSMGEQGRQARLWFWFRIRCGDICGEDSMPQPKIPIFVKWAHRQDGKFIVKRTVPLTVKGSAWRTWAYKQNLEPGTWRVAVFAEHGPLCLGDQCVFTVEVKQ